MAGQARKGSEQVALIQMSYDEARPKMRPGDVIAYGGYTFVSEIIKWSTRSKISHLGVILQTRALGDQSQTRFFNLVVESTRWDGFVGVGEGRLSDRLEAHKGEAWWLPMRDDVRQRFDEMAFFNFIYSVKFDPFDLPQAVQAAIDFSLRQSSGSVSETFHNQEDLHRFFCSELVSAALAASGAVPQVNASEVTPIDLCQWNIFQSDYYQLKKAKDEDKPTEIPRYNTLDPALWVGQPSPSPEYEGGA